MEPLFLNPYFRPKIWGGRKLKDIFNYDIPDGKVGEAWIISGYKDDASTVT
ncbi:MAG: mannose-6-phosphate isomerase, partial [Lactobacillus sp.]|nr:mannose-6-phosphate isomerase [Lactobacillus sp.]